MPPEDEKVKRAIIRNGSHHLVIDIDRLLESLSDLIGGGGSGSGGSAPVVDSTTGQVVGHAHPDPDTGTWTYVDPEPIIVIESGGSGQVSPGGVGGFTGGRVLRIIPTPSPEPPPPVTRTRVTPTPEPEPTMLHASTGGFPITQPHAEHGRQAVRAPCVPGGHFNPTVVVPVRLMLNVTNGGQSPVRVMFIGPIEDNSARLISEVELQPGAAIRSLVPPSGAVWVAFACNGQGAVTVLWDEGIV